MKKVFLFIAILFATSLTFANTNRYAVDESQIDALFSQATEVSISGSQSLLATLPLGVVAPENTTEIKDAKQPIVAFLLCWFLGGFGIHRHYLGTSQFMWALYTFTCGGIFGIIPLVDWIMLLIGIIENNIGSYENNTNFIMW